MIKVGVFGYGTVGSGVVEVITENAAVIAKRVGEEVAVKAILDLRDFPGDKHEDKIVHDVNQVVDDPEISIICETMGGVGAAYKFTKMALEAGKSVCTSNKELVALHGDGTNVATESYNGLTLVGVKKVITSGNSASEYVKKTAYCQRSRR